MSLPEHVPLPPFNQEIVSLLETAITDVKAGKVHSIALIVVGGIGVHTRHFGSPTELYVGAGLLQQALLEQMRGAAKPGRILQLRN